MDDQRTEEWHEARRGRVTASRIADVMMKPTTAGYQNYRAQLVCERLTGVVSEGFTSAAMQHGIDTEPQARAMYELVSGQPTAECGFIQHPTLEWSGASPDGLVGDRGLVEIKCPQPAKHIANLTGGSIDRGYLLQMQWQMVCTERDWCDFVSFSPAFPPAMQLLIQRVERDDALCTEIEAAVQEFLHGVDALTRELTERYAEAA